MTRKEEKLGIEEVNIVDIEVKDDGKKIDLNNFQDWYVWVEAKEKDSIFKEGLDKGSE